MEKDFDITWEKLDEWYESELANSIGNLVSRVLKLSELYGVYVICKSNKNYNSLQDIQRAIKKLDLFIQTTQPFKTKNQKIIKKLVTELFDIAISLKPFMPETSNKIIRAIKLNKKPASLFPR